MSFSVDFVATVADAEKIVAGEYLPCEVKLFIGQALRAFTGNSLVKVRAVGHLYNADYQRSNADIVVEQVVLRGPKVN